MSKRLELAGKKFGKWIVLCRDETPDKNGYRCKWFCQCECGKRQRISTGVLNSGKTNNCLSCSLRRRKGPLHASWKGGRYVDAAGYITIWSEELRKGRREHTLIAEKILGRRLRKNEEVHHINGNKKDNRNCNLLICSKSYHRWLECLMSDLYKKEHFV